MNEYMIRYTYRPQRFNPRPAVISARLVLHKDTISQAVEDAENLLRFSDRADSYKITSVTEVTA